MSRLYDVISDQRTASGNNLLAVSQAGEKTHNSRSPTSLLAIPSIYVTKCSHHLWLVQAEWLLLEHKGESYLSRPKKKKKETSDQFWKYFEWACPSVSRVEFMLSYFWLTNMFLLASKYITFILILAPSDSF